MKGQIIKQPNGKYCIFSSVVDNITYYDMTADEIINDSSMPERVRQAIDELEDGGKPYFQFTLTFDEMLERIKQVHGRDELDRVIELVRPRKKATNMQRGDIFKKHSDKLGLLWTSEQWETVMAAMGEFAEQEVQNATYKLLIHRSMAKITINFPFNQKLPDGYSVEFWETDELYHFATSDENFESAGYCTPFMARKACLTYISSQIQREKGPKGMEAYGQWRTGWGA